MSESVVAASGVTFEISGIVLVDDVELDAERGEFVAVCGPNGAGKSMLLRLLAGDLLPSAGRVHLDDLDTASATPTDLARIRAVMQQGSRTNVPHTAAAVVEMGRYPHRLDPDASRDADVLAVRNAMERTDTAHLAGRIFATLSGGEQTRVVMARILAQAAPVVLLDEPTTALDVAHRERALAEMRRMVEDGNCVVAVLHDLNAAAYYADRVVLMNVGKIHAEGRPDAVLNSDLLSALYGQPMVVTDHPTRHCPLVLTT